MSTNWILTNQNKNFDKQIQICIIIIMKKSSNFLFIDKYKKQDCPFVISCRHDRKILSQTSECLIYSKKKNDNN